MGCHWRPVRFASKVFSIIGWQSIEQNAGNIGTALAKWSKMIDIYSHPVLVGTATIKALKHDGKTKHKLSTCIILAGYTAQLK